MSVQRLWTLAVGCLLVLASSCGKEPVEKDNCAGVVCELGVCDAASGSCRNPDACDDANVCLAGHECVSGECVATVACGDDAPCERGVCESGACVNPGVCEGDVDCVAGSSCADGVCVADACADVTCGRGVCERSTGECVNATVCTPENAASACLDGFVCYDQACAAVDAVCEAIACERGACDTNTLGCANPQSCEGSDGGLEAVRDPRAGSGIVRTGVQGGPGLPVFQSRARRGRHADAPQRPPAQPCLSKVCQRRRRGARTSRARGRWRGRRPRRRRRPRGRSRPPRTPPARSTP